MGEKAAAKRLSILCDFHFVHRVPMTPLDSYTVWFECPLADYQPVRIGNGDFPNATILIDKSAKIVSYDIGRGLDVNLFLVL